MEMEKKEIYEIVRWAVVVTREENGRQFAEVVGYDKDGNEYRVRNQMYVHGEYHEVEHNIICTEAPSPQATQ